MISYRPEIDAHSDRSGQRHDRLTHDAAVLLLVAALGLDFAEARGILDDHPAAFPTALLEGLPALLIFGPILFPISRVVGVDPVHYGIVVVAAMGIAFFLPPVGVGLTIAAGIGRVDIDEVSRSYVPYLIALLIGLALIAAFPSITLLLPRLLLGYKG